VKLATQKALYNTAMLLAPALVVPPFLLFKRGRDRLLDRFGLWNLNLEKSIWLHGASLGEMIGLSNIATELKSAYQDFPIVASATSPTGLPKAREFAVASRLLPFDHPLYFKRAVREISPKAFIFGETELWPNLISHLAQENVPTYLVNGRISDKTFGRYLKFRPLVAESMGQISHIFAASEQAKERFLALGASSDNVTIVANTKYDISSRELITAEQKLELKNSLFKQNLAIVVLSSIRPGEEELLFEAIKSLEQANQKLCYIIAPRHSEKFAYFESKMRDFGFEFKRRTEMKEACHERFLFLNTLGELNSLLPAAELVFVGGTLADYGGHNPLEPAAFGVAPVLGPYSATVKDIVLSLREKSALFEVATSAEIAQLLFKVTNGNDEITCIGKRARLLTLEFSGGSRMIVERVQRDLQT
jgi:3-deoxy-D-manno-octulosonic-acid transferase